ncbi:MAG: succinylglutamate desuccinylase/aspartoacylase family protein [Gammaproteobacteria bacterium]|nr:succinylglutamate desuccinylase/aspartoacylase family protein [Gammaproteobacteria bacterium]
MTGRVSDESSGGAGLAVVERLRVSDFEAGRTHRAWLAVCHDALGLDIKVPLMVLRAPRPGPIFAVTAAVHGNEVNGIPVIHELFRRAARRMRRGTLVGVPVVAVEAFMAYRRTMEEGFDLNRSMPGRADGHVAEQFGHALWTRLIEPLDYLVDLHTASLGRINSLYVRADMSDAVTRRMALLQAPQIVVHSDGGGGTFRGAARNARVAAITVEIGNPMCMQPELIERAIDGVWRNLVDLGLVDADPDPGRADPPALCVRGYWLFARHGGLLELLVGAADPVQAGQPIARVTDIFGAPVATYDAPHAGVVIGHASNPICRPGARVLHIGVPGEVPVDPSSNRTSITVGGGP